MQSSSRHQSSLGAAGIEAAVPDTRLERTDLAVHGLIQILALIDRPGRSALNAIQALADRLAEMEPLGTDADGHLGSHRDVTAARQKADEITSADPDGGSAALQS